MKIKRILVVSNCSFNQFSYVQRGSLVFGNFGVSTYSFTQIPPRCRKIATRVFPSSISNLPAAFTQLEWHFLLDDGSYQR